MKRCLCAKYAFVPVVALLTICMLLGAVGLGQASTDSPEKRKQILLLNSYHQNFSWNEAIFEGLADVLRPRETGIVLHVENMDTKRVEFNEHYLLQLKDVFEHKFRDMKLDLIMVTDNNALEFMRRFHGELFPGVPVVFCGVNFFRDELIKGFPLFTGVVENVDVKGTLWWALKLHPGTKLIYIINDMTPSGRALADTIRHDLAHFKPGVEVRYSKDLGMGELLAEVASLPEDSLVLYGVFNRDKDGRFYDTSEGATLVAARSRVPMYGLIEFDLGHGIVGGMLTSGYTQGQSMAQIALHVLAGRHPSDIPVIKDGISLPMFDYTALKKHGINIGALPEESEIINRPKSFYFENSGFIWAGMAFTAIQMVIILFLMAATSRRKQAEKELRRTKESLEERVKERTSEVKESVEALRTVFDASHDAIIIHDVTGNILDVNERMLKMFGITQGEVSSISIAHDISSRDNAVYRLSSIWRSVINGESQFFEWKARRPHDGSEFDAEIYLNRIVFHGKEAILANVRDITVRKESENRIRQSLSKFEAILENSLMGIAMSRSRKFVTINRRGAEIFGYSPGEIIGNDVSLLLDSHEAVENFVVLSREALSSKGDFDTEQAFRDKDGSVVWCRMYAKAVDPSTLDKGIIWAWDDVTEHRQGQEELMRAREDAEAANRAKSEFLAAMSHEIRTPMNAIVGMTDITLQTDLNETQRDYLRTVMDSSQHLLNIINDILDLSKIEAQKLVLDKVDFDLPFHVQTTIKGLEMQATQKGLDMVLDVDAGLASCVKGDPLSLRQVLMNLVGNAIKFTHRGSVAIRVFPARRDPHRDPADPRNIGISFEVEDTGIGIPEEFMDTIFQSFSQTTRAFGGTGLGLAICKQLIGLMGGDICVESKVGKGSTFAFTVWYEPGLSCSVPADRPEMPEAPSRPVRVLVAEDNDVNVMVTTLRLEDLGYTYSVAGTGLEVLDLLKREPFDLILMDIEMPVLDGISATKAIRASVPGGAIPNPDIPIIGVTAHALKEFREKSLDAGMDDYVSKPVDFHELSNIINRLVGGLPTPKKAEKSKDTPQADAPENDAVTTTDLPLFAPAKAMEDLGVDETIFQGFLETAQSELLATLTELETADPSQDRDQFVFQSKTIKSICTVMGAPRAALAAGELEFVFAEDGNWQELLQVLRFEIDALLVEMNS